VFTGSVFPHPFCAGHRFTLWKTEIDKPVISITAAERMMREDVST
jgi:hypothetical protein